MADSVVSYANQGVTVQTVKGSAGYVTGYHIYNPNAAVIYLQFFDTVGAVTLGATVPTFIVAVGQGTFATRSLFRFATGIKFACATTATGAGAPGAGLDITFSYN